MPEAVTAAYLPEKQPDPKPAPPRIEIVTTGSVLDYSDSWSGFKLTPERLTWILRQADWGWPLQMYDMFEAAVLADGHARGLYEQRLDEQCVPWTWRAGDDRPGSIQAANDMSELTAMLDMEGAIEFLALAPFFGSSYIEVAWVTRADGRQVPVDFVCVPHRRFLFDPQTFAPRLTSETNSWPGDALERRPGSSWMCAHTRRWRKPSQAAILRTVAWWALFKRMSVRDWMIFAEKFGIPLVIGKPGENDSQDTRAKLKDAIAALGTEGRAILGGDATIQVLDQALRSGGGEHLHAGIVQLSNSEISKCITAGTLTADVGGPGSFALGQVHADQKHKLSLADARRIGTVFTRDLAREYLVRNRLLGVATAPELHLHVQKLSLLTDSQVLKNLVGCGLPVSKSQVYDTYGYRAPMDAADTLTPPTPQGADNADPADPREPADPPS